MCSHLETVTDESFENQVVASSKPYLLEFIVPWCMPCAAFEATLFEVAVEQADRLRIGQLNMSENPLLAKQFEVFSAPTMILFREGRPIRRLVGVKNKRNLMEALREYMGD